VCRGVALVFAAVAASCVPPTPNESWTCDFDAHESRPLSNADATAGPDGELSASECENTCGPPAMHCTSTVLDGGVPGAVCPVCTFTAF